MSFFEDIAAKLDESRIESRVTDGTLFVPVAPYLEARFEEIDATLPAANVYTVTLDPEGDDIIEQEVLVAVVTSVEAAVDLVAQHVAVNEAASLAADLVWGDDERLEGLDFIEAEAGPYDLLALVGECSAIGVNLATVDGSVSAWVSFISVVSELDASAEADSYGPGSGLFSDAGSGEDPESEAIIHTICFGDEADYEVLDLGEVEDLDRVLDVVALAADHADEWESELLDNAWELDSWTEGYDD